MSIAAECLTLTIPYLPWIAKNLEPPLCREVENSLGARAIGV
jgi:hypothetical protein